MKIKKCNSLLLLELEKDFQLLITEFKEYKLTFPLIFYFIRWFEQEIYNRKIQTNDKKVLFIELVTKTFDLDNLDKEIISNFYDFLLEHRMIKLYNSYIKAIFHIVKKKVVGL